MQYNDNDHNNIDDDCGDQCIKCLVSGATGGLLFQQAIMSGWRHTVARDEIRDVLVILSFVMVTMMANVLVVIMFEL